MALPEGTRRSHVRALGLAQRLAADEPAKADPAGDAERDAHGGEALSEDEDDGDEQQDLRDGGEGGVEILDGVVHAAAEIAGEDAKKRAQRDVDRGGQAAEDERGLAGFERLAEHILAERVGAEQVPPLERFGLGGGEERGGERSAVGFLRRYAAEVKVEHALRAAFSRREAHHLERAEQQVEADHDEGDEAGAIRPKAQPGAPPALVVRYRPERPREQREAGEDEEVLREPVGEENAHGESSKSEIRNPKQIPKVGKPEIG